VAAGRLLEELHWRLSTLVLEVPPLRERRADLPALAERFLGAGEKSGMGLTPAAWEALAAHAWPGNLAELRRVLLAASARAAGERIDLDDLPMALREARLIEHDPARTAGGSLALEEVLAQVERRLIRLALARARGNRSRAAELLGIHRPRLLRRMEALGIEAAPGEGD
jgi:DNA-binding NtrC family response regulator